jgi:hypothetical protein
MDEGRTAGAHAVRRRGGASRATVLVLAVALASVPAIAPADDASTPPGSRAKRTLGESVRTGGHAARNGILTFGRSTRALFTGGTAAARRTWKENAARTGAEAKADGRRTRAAARGE